MNHFRRFEMARRAGIALLIVLALATGRACASAYSDLVLSHGPIAYWRLGESSGTTAADAMGAHNGTYQNNVALGTEGAIVSDANTAATFGGANNDRVQVSGFAVSGGQITILAWFRPDGFGNDSLVSKATGAGTSAHHWMLGINGNNQLRSRIKINGTTRQLTPNVGTMTAGVWYLAAVTFDGSTMRVYLNGQQVDSRSWSGSVSNDSGVAVGLGNQPSGAGNRAFDGTLDEVAVYDKALTAAQVLALYDAGTAGLRGHWKLDETSGNSAADSSGKGQTGTVTGTAAWVSAVLNNGLQVNYTNGNDYVTIPNSTNLENVQEGNYSLAAWFKPHSTPPGTGSQNSAAYAVVVKEGHHGGLHYTNWNGFQFDHWLTGNTWAGTGTWDDTYEPGRFYHVAGVVDRPAGTVKIYVDGHLKMTDTFSPGTATREYGTVPWRIGIASPTYTEWAWPADGVIDDVRIYSQALTDKEVAELYGLIGRWKLDETTGTTAYDTSGMGNNGTYLSGVTLAGTAAPLDNDDASVFDGNNDYVSIGNEADYDLTGTLTIATWIKVSSFTKTWQAILTKGDSAWRLSRNSNSNTIHFACTGLSQLQVNGSRNVNDGQWHHIAGVYDGNSLDLYVDGTLDATAASTGNVSTNNYNVEIGRNAQAGGREFHGAIYDSRVYNRALLPEEIAALYGTGGSTFDGVKIIKWVEIQ
jgi:hypothetical protein